ncbi:hypothetical protein BUALT_Bualt04G0000100 [Buddleja alternifolia]|uniref:Protection of telomeres protein 1 n=1 Tax=Buddleja alternifolia TaxID=168488 RepID=A0AAV6XLE5_9LAMI|nr:hypothetical protein BUALT_Bualt04G0000100 [Buddleja alternifolia]
MVDILGIVAESGISHKSKGTDYCLNLKITDDSVADRELSINAFHRNIHDLPRVHGHLDFILLYNVLYGNSVERYWHTGERCWSDLQVIFRGLAATSPIYEPGGRFHDPVILSDNDSENSHQTGGSSKPRRKESRQVGHSTPPVVHVIDMLSSSSVPDESSRNGPTNPWEIARIRSAHQEHSEQGSSNSNVSSTARSPYFEVKTIIEMYGRRHIRGGRVKDWHWVTVDETANNLGRMVDILGIVVESGISHKSKGTDYCLNLKIIDDSVEDRELSINAFHRNIHDLPRVRGHLDVILLHNVLIDIHDQNPCASFRRTSAFALFDGRDDDDCKPYQLSPGFQGVESAEKLVHYLRFWSYHTRFDAGTSEYVRPLADIGGRYFVDLVCKVLHVCEVSRGKWMLYAWDGTDAPSVSVTTNLTGEQQNSLPLHIEPFCLPGHVLRKFPCVGTILRILVDENYEEFGVHFQHGEKWVRLRNVMCKTESGLWKGVFTLETKFRPLSEQDGSVQDCLRVFAERVCEQGRVPSAAFPRFDVLTVTGNEEADFATLQDILCSPLPCGGFKCVVRVVAVYPLRGEDFRSPEGLYRLRLTLEDPTSRIHAYLSNQDATFLFGGYPTDDVLTAKMNKLLGVQECEDSPRDPPWVQCCIGFNSSDVNDVGSKHFHICKTRFVV